MATNRVTTADLMTAIMAQTQAIGALTTAITTVMAVPAKPVATVPAKPVKTANKSMFDARLANATLYAKASGRTIGLWAITKKDGTVGIYNYGVDKKPTASSSKEVLLATVNPAGKVVRIAA